MNNDLWKFSTESVPSLEETLAQAEQEPILFPEKETITPDWILASQIYQYLFGIYLKEKAGLDRLDERIAERNVDPAPEDWKKYYQKHDQMGLRYFFFRGAARVERLADEDRKLLTRAMSGEEADVQEALIMVAESFSRVMTIAPDQPNVIFEPRQTIYGDYKIAGDQIPLVMRSVAAFLPNGSLRSESEELERIRLFSTIWQQLDDALSADLGCRTRTTLEVFEI